MPRTNRKLASGKSLSNLPRTSFSGLDFDNIIRDITELVLENPDFNENWDDFLSSNAGRMLVELFAYITDNLATRIDWVVNENFIGTAKQKKSIVRLLKLIGYNLKLPFPSRVQVDLEYDRAVGNHTLSANNYNIATGELDIFSLTARDRNGVEKRNFEAIIYDDFNQKYEYTNPLIVSTQTSGTPNLSHTITFYEGTTIVDNVTVDTSNNFSYILPRNPVLENSIRVFLIEENDPNVFTQKELIQVNSFLQPEAQRETDAFNEEIPIPYILNVLEDDRVSIEFGPTSLLSSSSRRPTVGNRLRIFYRVGGGVDGNITRRSISTTRRFTINSINTNVTFINNTQGSGGLDGEDIGYASVFGPLQIRTAQKAVTEEDYDIILSSNQNILKTKSYGNNNLPSNLFNIYRLFIRPLEVWNYVVLDKPGWRDVPPSRYKDFNWFDLRLQNRFNEKYNFIEGSFNKSLAINSAQVVNSLNLEFEEDEFVDMITINPLNTNFVVNEENILYIDNSLNDNFKLVFTSSELQDSFFGLSGKNNIFLPLYEKNNDGIIDLSKSVFQLEQNKNAKLFSTTDINNNVNMSSNRNIRVSFDNRQVFQFDVSDGAANASLVTPVEIVNRINEVTEAEYDYDNYTIGSGDPKIKGIQKIQLTGISSSTDQIPHLIPNEYYSFKLNGIIYKFRNVSRVGGPRFSELLDLIQESVSFDVDFTFNNGSSRLNAVNGKDFIKFVKKGMKIAIEGFASGTIITNVNYITNSITVNNNSTFFSSLSTGKIIPFEVTSEISANSNIVIENIQEDPVGPVWIQNNESDLTSDIFTALDTDYILEPFTPSSCKYGEQRLGLNAVIEPTRGFQQFARTSSQVVANTSATYGFRLTVDGVAANGGSDIDIVIPLNTPNSAIVDLINTEFGLVEFDDPLNTISDFAEAILDSQERIRIVSKSQGSSSSVFMQDPVSGTSILSILSGVQPAIDGIDSPEIGVANETYQFKINEYTYSMQVESTDTYLEFVENFEQLINPLFDPLNPDDEDKYFLVDIVDNQPVNQEWNQDLLIRFRTGERVNFENIDLFDKLLITRLDVPETDPISVIDEQQWSNFGASIGGGDYSSVASIDNVLGLTTQTYLILTSPCVSKESSFIEITNPTSNSVITQLFGVVPTSLVLIRYYGYERLTVSVNRDDTARFGRSYYETGGLNYNSFTFKNLFYNFVSNEVSRIKIGEFFSDDINSPFYKEPALRIYNTAYNENTREVDPTVSNFIIKFTKQPTDEISIFNIQNSWNVSSASSAKIESVLNPQESISGSSYYINISIDERGFFELDLTGNGFSASDYTLDELIDAINSGIRNNVNYSNDLLYSTHVYATSNELSNRVIITSPLNNENSKIELRAPIDNSSLDAITTFFGLSDNSGYEYSILSQGDYYLSEDRRLASGSFTQNSNIINDVSVEILEQIQQGFKLFPVSSVIDSCYVVGVDLDNQELIVTEPALSTGSFDFFFSDNAMYLNKLIKDNGQSGIPDLEFYFHYINDRRFVPEFFDGRTITGGQGNDQYVIKTSGFPLGSLDDDEYAAFLADKKIVGVDSVFKQTRFNTFDIVGTIYYQSAFSREDVQQRVENSLRTFYGLENRSHGELVARSRVMNIIHQNEGVDYVEIDFLGKDFTIPSTDVNNSISALFDEIIVLSEDRFVGGQKVHGLVLNYVQAGS